MINRLAVVLLLVILPACNSRSPAAPPPVTPPPVTPPSPPNYSGTYRGPVLYNGGYGEISGTGWTRVTHKGNTVGFEEPLRVTIPSSTVTPISWPSGGPLSDDGIATGTRILHPDYFDLPDCGALTVRTISRFSGRLMNLTIEEEYERGFETCTPNRLVGELSRQEP